MLSKLIEKDRYHFNQELLDGINVYLDLSQIVIPFSEFFSTKRKSDIYSGNENIPFGERDHEYKSIFLKEFLK